MKEQAESESTVATADQTEPQPSQEESSTWSKWNLHAAAALVVIALGGLLIAEVHKNAPCNIDEPAWITSGYLTYELFAKGASSKEWVHAYDRKKLGDWGHKNPPVGKYLIGMLVALAKSPTDSINYRWQWPRSYFYNMRKNHLPPQVMLRRVRTGMVGFGMGVLFLVFLISYALLGKRWLVLLGPPILYLIPIFRVRATTVYTDMIQLFFLLLGLWLLVRFIKQARPLELGVALLCFGLSCATKFSSGLVVIATILFFLSRYPTNWKRRVQLALLAGFVPLCTFVLVNPYLHKEPRARLQGLLKSWSQSKRAQQQDPVLQKNRTKKSGHHLMVQRTVLNPFSIHGFTNRKLSSWWGESSWWIGVFLALLLLIAGLNFSLHLDARPPEWLTVVVGGVCIGALLFAVFGWENRTTLFSAIGQISAGSLIAIGVLGSIKSSIWRTEESRSEANQSSHHYLGLYFACTFLLTGWWLPFDWARYYLPTLIVFPIFIVIALSLLAESIVWRVKSDEGGHSSIQRWTPPALWTMVWLFGGLLLALPTLAPSTPRSAEIKSTKTSIPRLLVLWEQANPTQKSKISTLLIDRLQSSRRLREAYIESNFATARAPDHPHLLWRHALLSLWLGQTSIAQTTIRRAATLAPNDLQIRRVAQHILQRARPTTQPSAPVPRRKGQSKTP